MQNHKKLEDLLEHVSNTSIDKDDLKSKAESRAKKLGLDMEDRDFHSMEILFEVRSIISKQYNLEEESIDILMTPNGGDGCGLMIEKQHVEDIESFDYWQSGCWQ